MSKTSTVSKAAVRAANARIVTRESQSGRFSSSSGGSVLASSALVDRKRVADVGSRALPPPYQKKK